MATVVEKTRQPAGVVKPATATQTHWLPPFTHSLFLNSELGVRVATPRFPRQLAARRGLFYPSPG
jgi:hypothetical protein